MKKLIIVLLILATGLLAFVIASKPTEVKSETKSPPVQVKTIQPPTSDEVEAEVNKFRTGRGLPAFFSDNTILDQAAQTRADGMCASDEWNHNNAWTVLDQYYGYELASENLYYGTLSENQEAVALRTWSESPGHLENMLKPYVEIGIGVKSCPGFQGEPTAVIITNYFGVPR